MEVFIHEIKLEAKDDFSERFNHVSELYAIAEKEDTKEAWQNFIDAKICLEMGLPL